MKSRVFYDILQDSLQETISANDKDFNVSFNKLLELATKVTYQFEPETNPGSTRVADDAITEDTYSTIAEAFLDELFGNSSKLTRKEYMDALAAKQPWIFNSTEVRDKVEKEAGI